MICSRCGATNDDGNTFCNECGLVLRSSMSDSSDLISERLKESMVQVKSNDAINDYALNSQPNGSEVDSLMKQGKNEEDSDINDLTVDLSEDDKLQGSFSNRESEYHTLEALPSAEYTNFNNNTEFSVSNGKKAYWLVVLGIAIVVILGVLIYLFWPNITKVVMSPQKYYAISESKNIKQNYEEISLLFTKMREASYNIASEVRIASSTNGEASDENKAILDSTKLNINQKADHKNDRYKTEFELEMSNQSIMRVMMLEKDDIAVYSLPEVADGEAVGLSLRWICDMLSQDEKTISQMTGLNEKERKKVASDLVENVFLNSITEDNIVESEDELYEKQCDVTSFTINKKVRADMYNAMIEELKSNEKLRSMIISTAIYFNNRVDVMNDIYKANYKIKSESELQAVPDMMIEEIQKLISEDTGESVYKYSVYYSKSIGKPIVARKIENLDGVHVTFAGYVENKHNINKLSYVDFNNGPYIEFTNKYSKSGATVSGKTTVETLYDKKMIVPISCDYTFQKDAAVAGVPVLAGEFNIIYDLSELALNGGGTVKKKNQIEMSIASAVESKNVVKTLVDIVETVDDVERQRNSVEIISTYSSDYGVEDFEIPKEYTLTDTKIEKAAQIVKQRIEQVII